MRGILPLNHAGSLTVHVLSLLCPRNCSCLIPNAYVQGFVPCFNILLNPPIPSVNLILLFSELIFSSTCPQCNTGVTWITRAWSVFCISSGTVLSLHMRFPGLQKQGPSSRRPIYDGHGSGSKPLLHQQGIPEEFQCDLCWKGTNKSRLVSTPSLVLSTSRNGHLQPLCAASSSASPSLQ